MDINTQPVLIMAGGTGGHVYPAIAVADELIAQGVPVIWLGTRNGIEARVVPKAGIPIEWISIAGLRGKNVMTLLVAPFRLLIACIQALRIIWKCKPRAVLGMGGFVAGPGGLMAWLTGKPLLIHEQNAVPGFTNKVLSSFADHVMESFPKSFSKEAELVGNPVRKEILNVLEPEQRLKSHEGNLRLLIVGGSLGASYLNRIVPETISLIDMDIRPEIVHQTGVKHLDKTITNYRDVNVKARIESFIDDMAAAYSWADIVLCRSGATTVYELAAAGCCSILVPYPHAVDDHQTMNANYLADAGAAVICQQDKLTQEWLKNTFIKFNDHRDLLTKIASSARKYAMPNSAKLIAENCMKAGGFA